MRRPYVALELVPELMQRVFSGEKRLTIRADHRDYQINDRIIIVNATGISFTSQLTHFTGLVTSVCHTTLGALNPEELEADGFANPGEMLDVMRQFYPDITLESDVTVLGFEG